MTDSLVFSVTFLNVFGRVASPCLYIYIAMMFVKLYFRTSDIYLISLVSLDPSGFHLRTK